MFFKQILLKAFLNEPELIFLAPVKWSQVNVHLQMINSKKIIYY